MNNRNWKKLCKSEIKAKQLEINFKEVGDNMSKDDEGKTVKVISVDAVDECRAIQVGDIGEITLYEDGIPYVLLKSGLAKGSIYCMNEDQLEIVKNKIQLKDLKNYTKNFHLEAQLLNGTLIGCKDNKVSCIARVVEAKNRYGQVSKGIINTDGSCLWIPLDSLNDWIIDITEVNEDEI